MIDVAVSTVAADPHPRAERPRDGEFSSAAAYAEAISVAVVTSAGAFELGGALDL